MSVRQPPGGRDLPLGVSHVLARFSIRQSGGTQSVFGVPQKALLGGPNASGGFNASKTGLLESRTPLAGVVLYSKLGIRGMPCLGGP